MKEGMTRDKRIDILRGAGMILVVSGHLSSPVSVWIYSFHMPLFFFISGYLRYYSGAGKGSFKDFTKKKLKSLMLPYYIFWFISMIIWGNLISLSAGEGFVHIGLNEIKGLIFGGYYLKVYSNNYIIWFLQLMFVTSIVFEALIRYIRPFIAHLVILVVVAAVTAPLQTALPEGLVFNINALPAALVFMYFGYYLNKLRIKAAERYGEKTDSRRIIIPAALLLIASGWALMRINGGGHIDDILTPLYFVSAALTVTALFFLAGSCGDCRLLRFVGKNTLYILGLQSVFLDPCEDFAVFILKNAGIDGRWPKNILSTVFVLAACMTVAEFYCLLVSKRDKIKTVFSQRKD